MPDWAVCSGTFERKKWRGCKIQNFITNSKRDSKQRMLEWSFKLIFLDYNLVEMQFYISSRLKPNSSETVCCYKTVL